jgi:hypothetical protein
MKAIGLVVLAALAVGCDEPKAGDGAGSAAASGTAAATAKTTARASASTAASAAASGTASAAPAGSAAASGSAAAGAPKGLEAGRVVLGYVQDEKDEGQCAAVTDKEGKKLDDKDKEKLAKMLKAKWVEACPTENVVGTCKAPFGLFIQYTGPKYTADSAKKQCAKDHGKWVE